MGPPLSPRETRRSGRRSAPSASTSASKSPDSEQPPRQKEPSSRSGASSTGSGTRNRRPKQEELEDAVDERKVTSAQSVTSNGSTHGVSTKSKRKGKDKDRQPTPEHIIEDIPDSATDGNPQADEEEEQGITRCVCGSSEDDPDAGEFMVQCEGCKVWQHGLCMGYQSEDQVHDDDYYCEQCKPELHMDLLKKLANKKGRHAQNQAHAQSASAASRVSRSHSPGLNAKQISKRRNTMNSRDADFAESLKEIIEATAAEAAAKDVGPCQANEDTSRNMEIETEAPVIAKKKRKRTEDEVPSKKRTRSASTTSDNPASVIARSETPILTKAPSQAPAPPKPPAKNKRGGRKVVTSEAVVSLEGEEAPVMATTTTKRGGQRKANAKRPPLSHATSHNSGGTGQEHHRRTGQSTSNAPNSSAAPDSRAYRNSHAYAVSQQPLLTSWGLPDYLAHLEHMLPTHTPQPLDVPTGSSSVLPASERHNSTERTMERGVKVKWPSKRMSVGDMNKRVRALVEWVGREQASALDRERRRDSLESSLRQQEASDAQLLRTGDENDLAYQDALARVQKGNGDDIVHKPLEKESTASTMKQMEELMEELISFQERFGPGAKSRDRERRTASNS
ncbi:hypothetical protein FA15DRAFT_672019 [Coprinopsis marcescibilis]|uniref:PHD-type domain-containing protein n=1 Tax=Coprinopsis marcescibilis TaxID=230819 RepID=A0A5C3KPC7_COPMA|nr:hypothetical protein FA15DRAFT_672019 [Coprinopsis marcescibilis]